MFCCSLHVQLPSSALFHTSYAYNFDVNSWNYPACACILVKKCGSVLLSLLLNSMDSHLYQLPFLEIEIIPLTTFRVMPRKYITHEDRSCHKELSWKLTWYYIQFLRAYLILCLQGIFLFLHILIICISSRTENKLRGTHFPLWWWGECKGAWQDETVVLVQLWKADSSRHLNDSLLKMELQILVSSQFVLLFTAKMPNCGTPWG